MRKTFILLILLLWSFSIHAVGQAEIPTEYVDVGHREVTLETDTYSFFLPYTKPAGITEISIYYTTGLIVHELIIDGKHSRPKKQWGGAYGDPWDQETVENGEHDFYLRIVWSLWGYPVTEELIREGFILLTRTDKELPELYSIPFGTKEVYMTYSILYPLLPPLGNPPSIGNPPEEVRKANEQKYTVKWTLTWPELSSVE